MAAPVPARSDFIVKYPEFTDTPVAQTNEALADAAERTSATAFGTWRRTAAAVMLRAAVLLYKSPDARLMRKENPTQIKEWEDELRAMQRAAAFGVGRVAT